MKQLLSIALAILFALVSQAQDHTVTTFVNQTHTGGATHNGTFTFPADNSNYQTITMRVWLTCPPGGCDPWDRFSSIKVVKDGEEYEIGRFMTPYGNNWCSWEIDVTEYRELLTGNVELQSFIDTWNNGWDLSVDFEFYYGMPAYPYVAIQNLMLDYNFIYGDTIFYSLDIPSKTVTVPSNAERVIYRITNTGHGQGNTDNAAEFSQRTHQVVVDGVTQFNQFLWKSDCNANPCSPQAGTWEFARAGWCPGQGVTADDYDITNMVTPGQPVELDYRLETYFNDCSPWNPDCSAGVTCPECTYNSGSHTQPHYKISMQIIYMSSTPISIVSGIDEEDVAGDLRVFPNPVNDESVFLSLPVVTEPRSISLTFYDAMGKLARSYEMQNISGNTLRKVDVSGLSNGIYTIEIEGFDSPFTKKVILNR